MESEHYQYAATKELTRERLVEDIAHELSNPDFEGRIHGRNDAYRDGCRGPLCKYRERTRKREARDTKTRASLPCGVQPMRRARPERKWDDLIEVTLDEIRILGAKQWLDSRSAERGDTPVPKLAKSVQSPAHPESRSAREGEVAVHLLQVAAPRVPIQRVDCEPLSPKRLQDQDYIEGVMP